jgi:RHS repeat-associated protein
VLERQYDPKTGVIVAESDAYSIVRTSDPNGDGGAEYQSVSGLPGVARFFDEEGNEVTFNENNRQVVVRRYDSRGNLSFVRNPDGTWEEFSYDDRGLIVSQIDRSGARTLMEHDAMGRCVRIQHPDGSVETSEYDYLSRRVAHVDGAGRRTEWSYDNRSEIVFKRHPDGGEIRVAHDANRNPVRYSADGRVTLYEYGGMGWLHRVVHPDGSAYEMKYDNEGNRTLVVNPAGRTFRMRYDVASRLVAWTTFEGVEYSQELDFGNRFKTITTPLGDTELDRDSAGNVVAMDAPDVSIALEYSHQGLSAYDNGVAKVELQHDTVGRVVHEKQGDHENDVSWLGGGLAAIASDVGLPVRYGRRPGGSLSRIDVGSVALELGQAAPGLGLLDYLGDQLVRRRIYNEAGRMTFQGIARRSTGVAPEDVATPRDPHVLFFSHYVHDRRNNLLSEQRGDGTRVEYELSAADQVVKKTVQRPGALPVEERIAYDGCGSPRVQGGRYDALGRLVELSGETFEYDDVGRLVERTTDAGVWKYEWNQLDQLVRVVSPRSTVEMDYDGRSRRIRKRVLGAGGELVHATSYVWMNDIVLHEVHENEGRSRTYVRDGASWETLGHVDVVSGEERAVFYVLSPSGAVDFAVDRTGTPVWQADHAVFGQSTPTRADVEVSSRLVNQHYDRDVELTYNRYRWFDARVAQYVSTDPLFLDGNVNPRDYAPNPHKFADPTGLLVVPGTPGQGNTMPLPPDSNQPPPAQITNNAAGAPYLSAPGAWATQGTPTTPGYANCPPGALNRGGNFGAAQTTVDQAGAAYGCHSCGSRDSGYGPPDPATGLQHWTCDHQPPRSSYNSKTAASGTAGAQAAAQSTTPGAVRLYPHCKSCSRAQGQALSAQVRPPGGRAALAQAGLSQMQHNLTNPGPAPPVVF